MHREPMSQVELSHGLQSLYADVAREPVPDAIAQVLVELGNVKPGDAMGGRASPGVLMPGGQSSAA